MDDHEHVGETLDRYRTGELDEPERLRIERHLETCAACRGELEALVALARVIERGYMAERHYAARREPDWARLRAAVVERTHGRAPRRAGLARYMPQAALAVLALVAVGVLWEQGVRGPGDAEQALRSERPAGSSSDGAAESADRAVATSQAEPEERPTDEDRFAAPQRVEPEVRANAVPPTVSREGADDRRRDVGLDEAGLRDRAGAVERDADRAATDTAGGQVAGARVAPRAGVAEAVAPTEERVEAKARPDAARLEAEDQAREDVGKAVVAPPPELERFQTSARNALAEADTLLAARALAQWRDSLAPRHDLPPELERAAQALADSLAVFLTHRP